VRCASAGAERPEGGLRADPAYVVIPQEFKDDSNQKRRDVRAGLTKEAKKEASRKRKLAPSYSKKKRKVNRQ
jgi:hypothetical protein